MSPLFLAFMFLRTEYYPLSGLFGDWFCYFFDYTIAICGFTGQFHSFFLASFRYICLFHDGFMFEYNISPKVNLLFCYLITIINSWSSLLFQTGIEKNIAHRSQFFLNLEQNSSCKIRCLQLLIHSVFSFSLCRIHTQLLKNLLYHLRFHLHNHLNFHLNILYHHLLQETYFL